MHLKPILRVGKVHSDEVFSTNLTSCADSFTVLTKTVLAPFTGFVLRRTESVAIFVAIGTLDRHPR